MQYEVLKPFSCLRFVQAISFTAYYRWDQKVFETIVDVLIKWNGRVGKKKPG